MISYVRVGRYNSGSVLRRNYSLRGWWAVRGKQVGFLGSIESRTQPIAGMLQSCVGMPAVSFPRFLPLLGRSAQRPGHTVSPNNKQATTRASAQNLDQKNAHSRSNQKKIIKKHVEQRSLCHLLIKPSSVGQQTPGCVQVLAMAHLVAKDGLN